MKPAPPVISRRMDGPFSGACNGPAQSDWPSTLYGRRQNRPEGDRSHCGKTTHQIIERGSCATRRQTGNGLRDLQDNGGAAVSSVMFDNSLNRTAPLPFNLVRLWARSDL